MENASFIGLSLQVALRRQMDVVANNVANMSTTGFKNEKVLFLEHLVGQNGGKTDLPGKMSMVSDYGSYRDLRAGPITQTGNPLDIALQGPGYLAVQTANGLRYMRGGAMSVTSEGVLVDQSGRAVVDDGGGEIRIPDRTTKIAIGPDGSVTVAVEGQSGALQVVGRIGVYRFDRPNFLTAEAGGLLNANQEPALADTDTHIQQGMLEQSNVNPVLEMTRMIDIQRTYQSVQKMLDAEHERERDTIAKLAKAA
ncbi:MAG: flgF [Rhodospirillales bacterium]|nr:flgF [Rhodospirillales bacterium]